MDFLTLDKVFIVAELSANHLQNFDLARRTIEAMAKSGADAVKLQTYTPDTMTIACKHDDFLVQQGTLWDGETFYELYQRSFTPWEWHQELKELAESLGLVFFSTPFDLSSVDFLEKLGVPCYKIASFEITDIPLIEYVAGKGKPVLISTGIATLGDIEEAVETCRRVGNNQVVLLKCVSAYPTPLEEINLRTIPHLAETFGVPVGLSDHTLSPSVAVAAVALGAKVVEKHFILERALGGPDASFSLEPEEFKAMVQAVRGVEKALGQVTYTLSERQKRARAFSRSLYVVKDVRAGEKLTTANVRSIRPGYGLPPKYLRRVLGERFRRDLPKGTPLRWEDIE